MRPTFEVPLLCKHAAFLDALGASIEGDDRCEGKVFRRNAFLLPIPSARHFWSPYLQLEIRLKSEEPWASDDTIEGDMLFGRFSPHPNVWTGFMAVYALLAMVAMGGAVYGVSEWMLGEPPYAWLAVPAALALGGFVYGAVFIGQGLGAEQMYELRSAVDRACLRCDTVPPPRS